jgi:hypothetical protein
VPRSTSNTGDLTKLCKISCSRRFVMIPVVRAWGGGWKWEEEGLHGRVREKKY